MFGVDAFEFDNEIGLQTRIDEDPGIGENLAEKLASLYQHLIENGEKARERAEKYYNKANPRCCVRRRRTDLSV